MKSIFITAIIILVLIGSLTAQKKQVSLALDLNTPEVEFNHWGYNLIACDDANYSFNAIGRLKDLRHGIHFAKLDLSGEVLWNIPVFPEDSLAQFLINNNGFLKMADTLVGLVPVVPDPYQEGFEAMELKDSIKFLLANTSGELLGSVMVSERGDYFDQPFGQSMFYGNDHLYLIVRIGGLRYFEIWQLNRKFEIINAEVVPNQGRHVNFLNLYPLENGNVLMAGVEHQSSGHGYQWIVLLDEQLNPIKEFRGEHLAQHGASSIIRPTSDGGFICTFQRDNEIEWSSDTTLTSTTINKFDHELNMEWEYIFYAAALQDLTQIKKVGENLFLGVGHSDDLVFRDVYSGALEGWVFLFSDKGVVLWDRYIADFRYNHISYFMNGDIMDCGGYALLGTVDHITPDVEPFINDPKVWYLTLDENGCWNGNCHRRILITGPETSETFIPVSTEEIFEPDASMEVFPNPASTSVTLVHEYPGEKVLRMVNMSGQLVDEIPLHAERSTINLRGMQAGLYIFSVYTRDGRWLSDKRVVVE